jgi:energy-coupling factor transport system permease protein
MNITIGQYYPVSSPVHSLDARTKIAATMLYIIGLFSAKGIIGYTVAFVLLAVAALSSNVPIRLMLKGLRGIFAIIVFTVVLNLFLTKQGEVVLQFYIIKITDYGIALTVKMAVRLVMLIVASSIMTLTTSPLELTVGMEYLLKPFKRLGVPSHEIAMMMSIALRFIPTLVEELEKIKKAQMARGAHFDTGNLFERAKSLLPLLVPLFVSSFRRADELAMAMEARCYRGDVGRTRMNEPHLDVLDYVVLAVFAVFVCGVLMLRLFLGL